MKKVLLFAFVAVMAFGCRGKANRNTVDRYDDRALTEIREDVRDLNDKIEDRVEERIEKMRRDISGTYKGTIPCADCNGIEVSLRLENDGEYVLKTKYDVDDDRKDLETEVKGEYSFNNDGTIITLHGVENQPNRYARVGDDIVQLDMDGNRVTGDHADRYILKK